jgi:hypothetical protein
MRPNPTLSLRVPPFTKTELKKIVNALEGAGVGLRQDDLVAVLIARATVVLTNKNALAKLATEIQAYRAKAKPLGF